VVQSEPDISVLLGIRHETTGIMTNREFTAEQLGAAMIAYCRQVGVPLPRSAEKSLAVSGDNLMLCVQVRARSTPLLHHLDAQRFAAKRKQGRFSPSSPSPENSASLGPRRCRMWSLRG
jgi:hypothetical protein